MEIRLIKSDEWPELEPIFEEQGGKLPDPARATASVAIDNGEIAGFWMLQHALHCGPLWIRPDHRGTRLWKPLHEEVDRIFVSSPGTGYYSFSGEPKVEEIFRRLGYQELPYKLWKKEF